jgi:hypothetical protein
VSNYPAVALTPPSATRPSNLFASSHSGPRRSLRSCIRSPAPVRCTCSSRASAQLGKPAAKPLRRGAVVAVKPVGANSLTQRKKVPSLQRFSRVAAFAPSSIRTLTLGSDWDSDSPDGCRSSGARLAALCPAARTEHDRESANHCTNLGELRSANSALAYHDPTYIVPGCERSSNAWILPAALAIESLVS